MSPVARVMFDIGVTAMREARNEVLAPRIILTPEQRRAAAELQASHAHISAAEVNQTLHVRHRERTRHNPHD